MKKSRVCALGLACFLGAVTAFSALAATSGGGALLRNLSDKNGLSSASLSGQNNPENLTPEEQAKAELDANILSGGGLGLDPELDPIVATTDWGLDIYFHNAGEGTWTNPSISTSGTVSTSALNGYLYFQGGNYNGVTGLKWVIIGYSTNTVSAGPVSGANVTVSLDTTDAGSLIKTYAERGLVYVNSYKLSAYTNAVGTTEIPAGCVLCISEKNLLDAQYQSSYSSDADDGYQKGARWSFSDLRTTMRNLCSSDITNFDAIRNKIQDVDLNQYYYRSSAGITKDTSYDDTFFALTNTRNGTRDAVCYNPSTYPQNYCIETYLGTYSSNASKRISYTHNTTTADDWWLRSGTPSAMNSHMASCVLFNGQAAVDQPTSAYGVRPAFVLKLQHISLKNKLKFF